MHEKIKEIAATNYRFPARGEITKIEYTGTCRPTSVSFFESVLSLKCKVCSLGYVVVFYLHFFS